MDKPGFASCTTDSHDRMEEERAAYLDEVRIESSQFGAAADRKDLSLSRIGERARY